MKLKNISLAVSIAIIQSVAYATDENIDAVIDSFQETHITTDTAKFASKTIMALGAVPTERDHFTVIGGVDRVVFLNERPTPEHPTAGLARPGDELTVSDFNHPGHRAALTTQFTNTFDLIIPDTDVTYFMFLDKSFIHDFTSLLKVGGKLMLKQPRTFHSIGRFQTTAITRNYDATDIRNSEFTIEEPFVHPTNQRIVTRSRSTTLNDMINGDAYNAKNTILQSMIDFTGLNCFRHHDMHEIVHPIFTENYKEYVGAWMHYHVPNCSVVVSGDITSDGQLEITRMR